MAIGPDVRDLAGNRLDQERDGQYGTINDIYEIELDYVPIDLVLENATVASTLLWAGEAITVSWQGSNASGAPLLGDWTDGVYLSMDDQWDINDIRLVTVEHTGGLPRDEVYSTSADTYVPGVLPADYYVLVRADIANAEGETTESNNVTSVGPLPVDVRALLSDGTSISGELTSDDRADYYAVQGGPSESLRLILDGQAITGNNGLFVSYESISTRLVHEYKAFEDGRDQKLVFTGELAGGTYYALVFGSHVTPAATFKSSRTGRSTYSVTRSRSRRVEPPTWRFGSLRRTSSIPVFQQDRSSGLSTPTPARWLCLVQRFRCEPAGTLS